MRPTLREDFVVDVTINWSSNRSCQTKVFDSWKATQAHVLRQKSVNAFTFHLGFVYPLQDVALHQCLPLSSVNCDIGFSPFTFHLGFVHPLQDVALHQCLPLPSVNCDIGFSPFTFHLGFVHPLQDVALHQCLPLPSVNCDIGFSPFTFHLGFVHPLQDVALHQCLPLSSVCCFPVPGGSLLPCYVVFAIFYLVDPLIFSSPWLPFSTWSTY